MSLNLTKLEWYTNHRVTSYELWVNILTSCVYCTSYKLFLLHELQVTFSYELRVTVYYTSYKLLFTYELQVTVYCTSYELLLLHQLRTIVYCTSCELLFANELWANFYMRIRSYFLTLSYNKDEDYKAVYDNKVMIKNYSLRSFFDKELGAH